MKKVKIIWIISLIMIITISFGLSIYLYNTPNEEEKIIINWANNRMEEITYKNTFVIDDIKMNKEMEYCILKYHYEDEQGENQSCTELWKMENNEIKTNLGSLTGTNVMTLIIGYVTYTPEKLKEIATKIENDDKTISFSANRITRLLKE